MKQVKLLNEVNTMLEEIVKHEKDESKNPLTAHNITKQSVINGLVMKYHKKVIKS